MIQRADELAEFVAIYWKDGKCATLRSGEEGARASFRKFDEYQLAKYDRGGPTGCATFCSSATRSRVTGPGRAMEALIEGAAQRPIPGKWRSRRVRTSARRGSGCFASGSWRARSTP